QQFIVIVGIKAPAEHHLLVIVHAGDAFGFAFGLGQSRQKHSGQNGDDRDNNKELDQRKSSREIWFESHTVWLQTITKIPPRGQWCFRTHTVNQIKSAHRWGRFREKNGRDSLLNSGIL